jgi:hypothetical protein
MTEQNMDQEIVARMEDHEEFLPPAREGYRLLRKVLVYHLVLGIVLFCLALFFPGFVDYLPIGGVSELERSSDARTVQFDDIPPPQDIEIVQSLIKTSNAFDQLGTARQLMSVLIGVWLLMLPVSWVHKGIHRASAHDHSLDETTLILPGIVAAIVLVVQHSLALAFSLAGIVAGVHFRRALQDTFDALFILVAIGTGIAAGVSAIEIAAVLTVFFCYSTLYVYYVGDGLESHHEAKRKALKAIKKDLKAEREAEP